ncbi:hypothetical protein F5Y15DRAFT_412952 [Xylariaceae sp. FL0016]|nr:hypothetical protein F5Y15DRAFT_412952 [Xylariaceae sp. FL0016]
MSVSARSRDTWRSRYLPREIEDDIALGVCVHEDIDRLYIAEPQLIVGNKQTGCHALCRRSRGVVAITFYHRGECVCLRGGEQDEMTSLSDELLAYRKRLILGKGVKWKMEAKFADMVVMKLNLGLVSLPRHYRVAFLDYITELSRSNTTKFSFGSSPESSDRFSTGSPAEHTGNAVDTSEEAYWEDVP